MTQITCSTWDLERLADEVRAEHRSKFRRNRYVGVGRARKRESEYTSAGIRLLDAEEIAEFRAHVARCIEVRS